MYVRQIRQWKFFFDTYIYRSIYQMIFNKTVKVKVDRNLWLMGKVICCYI